MVIFFRVLRNNRTGELNHFIYYSLIIIRRVIVLLVNQGILFCLKGTNVFKLFLTGKFSLTYQKWVFSQYVHAELILIIDFLQNNGLQFGLDHFVHTNLLPVCLQLAAPSSLNPVNTVNYCD
jgi:hypothetical protein